MVTDHAPPRGTLVVLAPQAGPLAERGHLRRMLARHAPDAQTLHVLHLGRDPPAPSAWDGLGPASVEVTRVRSREEAEDAPLVARIRDGDAILLSDAHPLRLTHLLGGSPLLAAIGQAYGRGALIIATGAGATALCATALLRGDGAPGSLLVTPGLGLLRDAVVDTHLGALGRFHRVLEVVARNPGIVGLALGEGSLIAVHGGARVESLGGGSVVVVDAHDLGHAHLPVHARGGSVAMERLIVHVLAEGYQYDLATQQYLLPAPRPEGPPAHSQVPV